MRRVAFIATSGPLADARSAPGELDGDAMRTRLAQDDTRFEVVDVDPKDDFALQIEEFFDKSELSPDDELLIYVSASVLTSVEGELFVCLDPTQPGTGDSVKDLALVLRERFTGRALFFLECRHKPDPADPFRSAALVGVAKDAVKPRDSGIGLLVAARPLDLDAEERMSPLTRELIAAIDRADPEVGLTVEQFYDEAIEELAGVVPGFAHVKGRAGFQLLAKVPRTVRPPDDVAAQPAAPTTFRSAAPPAPTAAAPSAPEAPVSDRRVSTPPMALPSDRSFQKQEDHLPKIMISDRPPPPTSTPSRTPSNRPPSPTAGRPVSAPPVAPPPPPVPTMASAVAAGTANDHVGAGDRAARMNDPEGALAAFKRALVQLPPNASAERAEVFIRIADVKVDQHKRREAISQYEKALGLVPTHPKALAALLDLNAHEGDWRAVQVAEDRILATIDDPDVTFDRLVEFGSRWQRLMLDDGRARGLLEMAQALKSNDVALLEALQRLYERAGQVEQVLSTRLRLAELGATPRARADAYSDVASYALLELKREELALELFERALDADPSLLDPLAVVARLLADRQEWSELERAYRRMLERAPHIPEDDVRVEVTWELCRRLGTLFRDHIEDPALALDAFEDAVGEKPDDVQTRLTVVGLARGLGVIERAVPHLQAIAALQPARMETFHELFEVFQRLRRPDEAFSTAA
ncbi:MAG TPA: hypothetical protein VGM56_03510, partial [Byssovorax sp.]